jgi:hypothetical protein
MDPNVLAIVRHSSIEGQQQCRSFSVVIQQRKAPNFQSEETVTGAINESRQADAQCATLLLNQEGRHHSCVIGTNRGFGTGSLDIQDGHAARKDEIDALQGSDWDGSKKILEEEWPGKARVAGVHCRPDIGISGRHDPVRCRGLIGPGARMFGIRIEVARSERIGSSSCRISPPASQ